MSSFLNSNLYTLPFQVSQSFKTVLQQTIVECTVRTSMADEVLPYRGREGTTHTDG